MPRPSAILRLEILQPLGRGLFRTGRYALNFNHSAGIGTVRNRSTNW